MDVTELGISTEASFLHAEKVKFSIVVMEFGITIEDKLAQLENVDSDNFFTELGISTESRAKQYEKAAFPISVMELGILTEPI